MQESLLSLMQMAKTSAALAKMSEAHLPFVSVMSDPTMGGVSASLAMLGDVNIAEPNALIGFAGPRVIEQTVREKLPEGFQHAEFLLEKGAIDMILPRHRLRDEIAELIAKMQGYTFNGNEYVLPAGVSAEELAQSAQAASEAEELALGEAAVEAAGEAMVENSEAMDEPVEDESDAGKQIEEKAEAAPEPKRRRRSTRSASADTDK